MKTPATVLLVVIAALLAVNLIVNLPTQEAKAQSHLKAPQLVDVAVVRPADHPTIVRIWSDGFAEYKVTVGDPGFGPQVWTPLPFNPDAPQSRPIAVTETGKANTSPRIYRLWGDGTVDRIELFSGDGFVVPEEWITEPN